MRCLAQEPERTPWSPPDRSSTPLASSQIGEQETFISELLNELTLTIQDLETHQIHMFYEAVGLMIGADTTRENQEHYLVRSTMLAPSVSFIEKPEPSIWAASRAPRVCYLLFVTLHVQTPNMKPRSL